MDVPEGWLKVVDSDLLLWSGEGGEEDGAQVVSHSSESPPATRSESITTEDSNAST